MCRNKLQMDQRRAELLAMVASRICHMLPPQNKKKNYKKKSPKGPRDWPKAGKNWDAFIHEKLLEPWMRTSESATHLLGLYHPHTTILTFTHESFGKNCGLVIKELARKDAALLSSRLESIRGRGQKLRVLSVKIQNSLWNELGKTYSSANQRLWFKSKLRQVVGQSNI